MSPLKYDSWTMPPLTADELACLKKIEITRFTASCPTYTESVYSSLGTFEHSCSRGTVLL